MKAFQFSARSKIDKFCFGLLLLILAQNSVSVCHPIEAHVPPCFQLPSTHQPINVKEGHSDAQSWEILYHHNTVLIQASRSKGLIMSTIQRRKSKRSFLLNTVAGTTVAASLFLLVLCCQQDEVCSYSPSFSSSTSTFTSSRSYLLEQGRGGGRQQSPLGSRISNLSMKQRLVQVQSE